MLNIVSGVAVLGLTEWLLLAAWLSQATLAWQYNLWAMIVVLFWAQPWSRSDPYRTGHRGLRVIVYSLLLMAAFGSALVFGMWGAWLVLLEASLLFITEITGRRPIRDE
jgi:hypothetical protein